VHGDHRIAYSRGRACLPLLICHSAYSSQYGILDNAIKASDGWPVELVSRKGWDWDRDAAEFGLPMLAVARQVVNLLSEAIAERTCPCKS
jgi:hypothetical protein